MRDLSTGLFLYRAAIGAVYCIHCVAWGAERKLSLLPNLCGSCQEAPVGLPSLLQSGPWSRQDPLHLVLLRAAPAVSAL